jgi:hypothetical protein
MAEIHLKEEMVGDFILKWVKDDSTDKHTVTLTKVTMNPNAEATTNLAVETKVKTMTYTE